MEPMVVTWDFSKFITSSLKNLYNSHLKGITKKHHQLGAPEPTVDGSEILHHLRLVVHPILFAGFFLHPRRLFGISSINSMGLNKNDVFFQPMETWMKVISKMICYFVKLATAADNHTTENSLP